MSDTSKLSITLKGGTGFDAPWIVLHPDTVNEARDLLGEIEASGLAADVARVANGLTIQAALGKELGARPVDAPQAPAFPHPQPAQAPQGSWSGQGTQQYAPAPQQPAQAPQQWGNRPEANPADAKHCIHGPMNFRPAGISKRTNQPYSAFWGCGSNVKGCKPIN